MRDTVRFNCPYCGQRTVVNADGKLRKHATWIADSVCRGTGRRVQTRNGRGLCMDCGDRTAGEDFSVHRSLWAKYVGDADAGVICIPCLEARMGRELWSGDFVHWPINNVEECPRTDRLRDRLLREEAS